MQETEYKQAIVNLSKLLPELITELRRYNDHQDLKKRFYPIEKLRKYDPAAVLQVVKDFESVKIEKGNLAYAGRLLATYRQKTGHGITLRHFSNILRQLEAEGKVTGTIHNMGRYGRTTEWRLKEG